MIIRSKAPLRIGLSGGGTDVSPYSDQHGGAILNVTIDRYAYATLEPLENGKIELHSEQFDDELTIDATTEITIDEKFDLACGIYNRIIREFNDNKPLSFRLTTFIDAPMGSGLGTSSTLAVAIIGAFVEWLELPLGQYDIAHLAFQIEREDLKMAGGKQDQYAATFGGINFMEFFGDDKVIVNPLNVRNSIKNEFEFRLLLYYTKTKRSSSKIIKSQIDNIEKSDDSALTATHSLKSQAFEMKEAILRGNLDEIGEIFLKGWINKKKLANNVTTPLIDNIYETALAHGATGGKISGAGGGGFMFFYCPGNTKNKVAKSLEKFGGTHERFNFTSDGLRTWRIKD
jgi:D-glycero-alpha-D-manno-heptose-7-phosphate kinase